jgi:hypothetical protein
MIDFSRLRPGVAGKKGRDLSPVTGVFPAGPPQHLEAKDNQTRFMMRRLLAAKLNQGPEPAGPDDGLPYNEGFGASQAIRYLKMAERGRWRGYHPGGQDIYLRRAKLG